MHKNKQHIHLISEAISFKVVRVNFKVVVLTSLILFGGCFYVVYVGGFNLFELFFQPRTACENLSLAILDSPSEIRVFQLQSMFILDQNSPMHDRAERRIMT